MSWFINQLWGAAFISVCLVILLALARKFYRRELSKLQEAIFYVVCAVLLTAMVAVAKFMLEQIKKTAPQQVEAVPDLRCEIFYVGLQPINIEQTQTMLTFWVKIVNDGAPSIAWRWKCRIEPIIGQVIEAKAAENPSILTLLGDKGQTNGFTPPESYLPNSLLEKPIERGAGKMGWVGFTISDPNFNTDDINRMGNRFYLSFEDSHRKTTTLVYTNNTKSWGKQL